MTHRTIYPPDVTAAKDDATNDVVRVLDRCIETCADGEKGFADGADDVHGTKLRDLFRGLAFQRGQFLSALEDAVRLLGADPRGANGAELRRTWKSYRRIVESPDDRTVIEGCVAADAVTLAVYETASREAAYPMPTTVVALVNDQYEAVQRAHADLRACLAARA